MFLSRRKSFIAVLIMIVTIPALIVSCTHFGSRYPSAVKGPEKSIVLVGNIPGIYLNRDKSKFYLGYVEIGSNRIINAMGTLTTDEADAFIQDQKKLKTVISLLQPNSKNFDAIYPGLLNLHNHTKQNVLPTWPSAKGQFQNRFEWRDWSNYKKSVSQNMNPWISYGMAMNCAAFRWSNLQNMINGTIFLQGPSSCITGFGIYKVEDSSAYVSSKGAVQAPTDLVYPLEMSYVWNVLKKDIQSGMSYEQALLKDIRYHCEGPDIDKVTVENINKSEGLKILSNKKILEASCTKETATIHPKFIRYVYYIHKNIANKKNYLNSDNHSAVIAHLAEGRRKDPYNQTEYQMIKLLGLNVPHVNFIHGVGLRGDGIAGNDPADKADSNDDYLNMAKNNMGLIWSPYSNLLLYGETLDIEAAHRAGVRLAIGSDWVPTGTKSVLEEVKLAARYVDRTYTHDRKKKLNKIFNDEYLYKMMTENSAKMINHWGTDPGEAGVGQLAVGAMGSVIVVNVMAANPYTNIVRKVTEKEVNLVIVDGNPIYGNINYLERAGISKEQYEIFSNELAIENHEAAEKLATSGILKPDLDKMSFSASEEDNTSDQADSQAASQEEPFLNQLANDIKNYREKIPRKDSCNFTVAKAFVTPNTKVSDKVVGKFSQETGFDLDRVSDIQLLLAVSSMTQSLNRLSPKGDQSFAMKYFPNLYTCSDASDKYSHRYHRYIKSDGNDELKDNMYQETRTGNRKGVPKTAEFLANQYGLQFEIK